MRKNQLQIAVIGCGRIGKVHAQSISDCPQAILTAVADSMPGSAEALASKHGTRVVRISDILSDSEIDAVVICTPTNTHQELILQASASRKAILCEKPVDMSVEAIEKAVVVVDAAGVSFMTGFNRRFDPDFAELERQLRAGAIGDIETVTITSRDPAPPPISYVKSSGGIFRDMMIHDLDMARFLLAEEPNSVFASGSCLVDPAIGAAGDVDTACVILQTASGRQVQITNSRRAAYGYDQRIEVHGSKGMLRVGNSLATAIEVANAHGFVRSPAQPFFLERYAAAYRAEMAAFIDGVIEQKSIAPGIVDGLRAQQLADAAAASWNDGQAKAV